jgi:peptidoglycan/LPS O-acetylase OafA/YrhL
MAKFQMNEERSKWAVLAATRFFLASVVLVGHLDYLPGQHPWTLIGRAFNQGSAVYGFLVISGYSIAASLERSSTGFYARRIRRIWPSYLVSVAMGVAVAASISHPVQFATHIAIRPLNWVEVLAALTMTQTFLAPALSADGQIWTLAVEWWDYMIAPTLRRCATPVVAALMVASLAFFLLVPVPTNPADDTGGRMFLILAWWWLSGFLYYRHRGTALGTALLFAPPLIAATCRFVGLAAVFGIAAVALCESLKLSKNLTRIFDWLGDLSYPLYLVHVPVMFALFLSGVSEPAVVGCASLAVAAAVLHLVDIPFRHRPQRAGGKHDLAAERTLSA